MIKSQSHLPRLLRLVRIEQVVVEVGCCTSSVLFQRGLSTSEHFLQREFFDKGFQIAHAVFKHLYTHVNRCHRYNGVDYTEFRISELDSEPAVAVQHRWSTAYLFFV